jgi:hypothetical protein
MDKFQTMFYACTSEFCVCVISVIILDVHSVLQINVLFWSALCVIILVKE